MATFIKSDLSFILQQIKIAEKDAAGEDLLSLLPNTAVPFGLRTISGLHNNLISGQSYFGAADFTFPRLVPATFLNDNDGDTFDANGPAPGGLVTNTNYALTGDVADADPRTISNLIVDMTANNPAAVAAAAETPGSQIVNGTRADGTPFQTFFIPNVAPDVGLSAPFNTWMTFFGQFFDHGLDLVTKGGSGTVFIPLQPDDPLFVPGSPTNFMVLTRATNRPGPDGVLGTADDIHEHENTTSPFVDQNQTYTSHPSHQVFLRAYALNAAGDPVATGRLITNRDLGPDGEFGTADDVEIGGMATWAVVKAQARDLLGINLTDADVSDLPLLATDDYGNFFRGPNGLPMVMMKGADGIADTADDFLVEGNLASPISLVNAVRTGHQFLIDIAHTASPVNGQTGAALTPDADLVAGGPVAAGSYDNELLDAHYIAGDGRVNENIGLTAVHHVFHSEHNRLVQVTKDVIVNDAANMLAGGSTAAEAVAFLNEWLVTDVAAVPATPEAIAALNWDGERLFQAAKFGTEMQYQHLVFEEFARTVQPQVDVFLAPEGFDATINPSIVAEFAHAVFRLGHSMLTETIDRLDPNFVSSDIGLIQAFLNPLAFAASGPTPDQAAGAIVRGLTRQVGNEIDEFVTEAVRNNLLGLPLDLPAINIARGRDTGVPTLNAARREFYDMTGDSQLKPYTSWADLVQYLKHPESLINFIAAYGTHSTITAATTLADKRAAAANIVLDGAGAPADRLDFLNSTGDYANLANGVTITGVDAIDLWIGGLAEEKMPFGGMLGSTFNFVFETQMEALQNGDRFYYLSRLAGLNFLTEMENNTFSKLVMLNTDATHLPALIFSTPGFILEVDPSKQFNASVIAGPDGILVDDPATPVDESADNQPGNADPVGGSALIPLVIRDDPATPLVDTNYLRYTGVDHVVLGGTPGDDVIVSSIGDDTLYGDGGNDRLEGGDGNDNIEGGAGDDIITDWGGDDVLKGDAGDDVIHGGNGENLILGGDGSDFIITGEDVSETFGGQGNDFILGAQMNLPTFGNEGDDWIEIGTSDGAAGDNFDPEEASSVIGHDVFITGGGFDEADGEGGDDIMVMSDGEDHFGGGGGFDWASYNNDQLGVTADLLVNDFIEPPVAPSNQGILDRFAQVEGLTGSAFGDVLRGDDADAAEIDVVGPQNSALNAAGIARIDGLQAFLNQILAAPAGTNVTSFGAGNIILGGGGSDIIEGRGGDDLIDGDRWLNVRIAVTGHVPAAGQPVITSVNSLVELVPYMLSGEIKPSQLSIFREVLTAGPGFDTAMFSGNQADYTVVVNDNLTPLDFSDDIVTVTDNVGTDGIDRLTHIERLQFADSSRVLVPGLNNEPLGLLTLDDTTPAVNQVLTVSAAGVTDADNPGPITGPIGFVWQFEAIAGSGIFQDIVALGGGNPATAHGNTFRVTPDLDGLVLRARAVYQDANGVLENVYSASTSAVAGVVAIPAAPIIPAESPTTSPDGGLHMIRADLQFILDQILIGEANSNAYGTPAQDLLSLLPNSRVPFGLRTVDGTLNNLVQGQTNFGAADQNFPLLVDQQFRDEQDEAAFNGVTNTNFATTGPVDGNVVDSDPRIISNLIVDQTITNPSAVQAFVEAGLGTHAVDALGNPTFNADGTPIILDLNGVVIPRGQTLTIPNIATDEGLSAPFNAWFTFFGQFFDHGLDLVQKGGNGTVFIPLQPDDPLITHGPDGIAGTGDELTNPALQFMMLTRATNTDVQPGADGILGTADDVHLQNNQTTPFVDQNQTYTSHPAHQVFLRAYELNAAGDPVATGRLITNRDLGPDGLFGTADDVELGGMATWGVVKAQARDLLGIELSDYDALNVPLVAVDAYGKFIPGANGFAQLVVGLGPDGLPGTADDVLMEGNPAAPISPAAVGALRTGHMFLADIAHSANPFSAFGAPLAADADTVAGVNDGLGGTYDNELLEEHFMAGDGRVNENIALTAVHHVFHAEHNRLVEHIKDVAIASNDFAFLNQWLSTPVAALPTTPAEIDALQWNGERLFQAARFGTEMQYQHLVFEEFARKVQPQVDAFLMEGQGYDTTIDPAIVAEFAHAVYRFGHSMLLETVDRLDPNFASSEIGLVAAFLNPLAFDEGTLTAEQAAGAIVRGVTRQQGNEIDNFVTEALRNNLLGLPLDLPTINLSRARDTGVPSLNTARREFYNATGDSQLTPYASWVDLAMNLRHESSIINFIAAYGTHAELTALDVDTLAEKRAVATAIVLGGSAVINAGTPEERPFVADETDRIAFLNSTGIYANVAGITTTGVDDVDLWVGGLAERQMPFGGLLGSTFNFVFENQMEKLQNGDRFYYLERTAGLNFLTELENNSFAKLIMANTNATHLPGDVFSTPGFILEVDPTKQFTGLNEVGPDGIQGTLDDDVGADGIAGNSDPVGGILLTPLVSRDNPATAGPDSNYLKYTGDQHVVLGGTNPGNLANPSGDDIIISSEGDDTLYGDGGNDRLEGGYGNDMILGGAGDDIITDLGGDDNLQGGDGNDAIQGGNGLNLILGGFGNDFIVTGEDSNEAFGGTGNDFILGTRGDEMQFGNEGDDWIEHGMADGSAGENFDTRGLDAIIGNDVFIGEGTIDRMLGEGGDDIMIGNGGPVDRYIGSSGFDWAVYKDDPAGANVDMRLRAFDETPVPQSSGSMLARFESVEGLSGSAFGDILQGDDLNAAAIAASGFTGSVLTNIGLINGLQGVLGAGVTSFSSGNIILGGNGSDLIQGNGGDDLIDGDKWLNVRISVRANTDGTGAEIDSADSMQDLLPRVFSGEINPGQLVIVREILPGNGSFNFDTAMFSDIRANYDIEGWDGVVFGADVDGDGYITVNHSFFDVDGNLVAGIDGVDKLANIERLQFADFSYALAAGNADPVGTLTINDTTPTADQTLTVSAAGVTDPDNVSVANPTGAITGSVAYFWQFEAVPGSGIFEDIIIATGLGDMHATGPTFKVTPDLDGLAIRVRAVYQDANGVLETAFSLPTQPVIVIAPILGTAGNDILNGTAGPDNIQGLAGNDTLNGLGGNDLLFGGIGNDVLNGGTGDDAMEGGEGDDQYDVDSALDLATEFAAEGTDLVSSSVSYTLGNHVENLTLLGAADINGTGNRLNNVITGNSGANVLVGGAGNDVLTGGAGIDTADYSSSPDGVSVNLGITTSQLVSAGSGSDTLSGIENLTGSTFNDTLTGDAAANTLFGALGNDTLDGGDGNDTLRGGQGDDSLTGGAGNDLLIGALGADVMAGGVGDDTYNVDIGDVVQEALNEGTDTVISTLTYTLGENVENLTLGGTAAVNGTGNELANTIIGNAAANTLFGALGNDTLNGGDGNDTLRGGQGDDSLSGGAGNDLLIGALGADVMAGGAGNDTYSVDNIGDVVLEGAGAGTDTVNSALNAYTLGANVENLVLTGAAVSGTGNSLANTITGTGGNNMLSGLAGNDVLNGGAGDDVLIGGGGKDTLAGGTGNDRFDYNTVGQSTVGVGRDVITDFVVAADRINLSAIDANVNTGANDAFTFIGAAAFSAAGQVRYALVGGQTIVEANTGGTLAADMQIELVGSHTLTAANFTL